MGSGRRALLFIYLFIFIYLQSIRRDQLTVAKVERHGQLVGRKLLCFALSEVVLLYCNKHSPHWHVANVSNDFLCTRVQQEQGNYKTCCDQTKPKCLSVIYPRAFLLPPPPKVQVIKPQCCESGGVKTNNFPPSGDLKESREVLSKSGNGVGKEAQVMGPQLHGKNEDPSRSPSLGSNKLLGACSWGRRARTVTHADKPQLSRRSKHLHALQPEMLVAEAMAQGGHVHSTTATSGKEESAACLRLRRHNEGGRQKSL